MSQCIGYWKSGENEAEFDDYLKDIGMGFAHRKLSKLITSYEDISQNGDEWVIHIHTPVREGTHRYKVGEEHDETILDGRKVRSRLEIDGEKMIIYQTSRVKGVPDVKVSRERVDENTLLMVVEVKCHDDLMKLTCPEIAYLNQLIETNRVKAKRTYIKQEKKS